jgi:hypothetical protein
LKKISKLLGCRRLPGNSIQNCFRMKNRIEPFGFRPRVAKIIPASQSETP